MRTIIHIDMDAFYAAIEQRDNPEFYGKPVIVGADPKHGRGRGVVSTASYEARRYGIHSAQPISQAFKLCPHGIFLPVRGKYYAEVSARIMKIFHKTCPCVEPVSLDEAFLDMTGMERLKGSAEKVGKIIKEQIREQEKLTASVGIGPNKLIAKMASESEKPDGFVIVRSEELSPFLSPLLVSRLWGVGPKTKKKLGDLGIYTIGELSSFPPKALETIFGRWGKKLHLNAQGIDDSPVIAESEAKSISNETTFSEDVSDLSLLRQHLHQLSEKVGYRLRKRGLMGRTVTLKIRLTDFSTFVRHSTLQNPTLLSEAIYSEILQLFDQFDLDQQPVRLLGVGITQLVSMHTYQKDLFEEESVVKRKEVTALIDRLKSKYGEMIIQKGSMVKKNDE